MTSESLPLDVPPTNGYAPHPAPAYPAPTPEQVQAAQMHAIVTFIHENKGIKKAMETGFEGVKTQLIAMNVRVSALEKQANPEGGAYAWRVTREVLPYLAAIGGTWYAVSSNTGYQSGELIDRS